MNFPTKLAFHFFFCPFLKTNPRKLQNIQFFGERWNILVLLNRFTVAKVQSVLRKRSRRTVQAESKFHGARGSREGTCAYPRSGGGHGRRRTNFDVGKRGREGDEMTPLPRGRRTWATCFLFL